ncbi:restriction endonuclease subunit S [Vibrio splendidus]|uniref:restriction endonuclease subunit S n=1 Tax=Vibrio splendidus TaxID=29497 RepID=UPI002468F1B5|nr:restriction endonuclease subunit S [Vibrio splendidus]MDH6016544.1 restriction endonuclease subunit S [Vibrio splendidus]
MSELPKGWITTKFTEIFDVNGGTQPPKKEFISEPKDGYLRLLQIRDFGKKPVPTYIPDNRKRRICTKDDILIGRYGASVGRICTGMEGAYNVALARVDRPNGIDKDYLKYFLKSDLFQYPLTLLSRSAQNGFNKTDLSTFDFAIAPLNEQIRIANKLDSILAKVDKAQARLDKIPAILKRFRQSVLAAATSGELTKEWREGESDLSNLLVDYSDKIEIGRLDSWTQSKLREFDKKGKFPKDDKWKDKYSTKREHLTPEGRVVEWNYESLEYLADVIDPNPKHRNPKYFDEGFHFISTAQFDGYDEFDLSSCKFVGLDTIEEQKERCNFTSRSIAVSRKGTIGETRILELDFPFALLDSVCVVNVDKTISYRYLNYALRGEWVQKQIYAKTKGVALKQISVGAVRELIIPLPTYSEQCVIVEKLDSMLSKARKVETQYLEAKARLDRLTQSILAKAFRGELVPQDPTDEAADKLLERILAERELEKPRKKTTKKRVTKAKTVEKG